MAEPEAVANGGASGSQKGEAAPQSVRVNVKNLTSSCSDEDLRGLFESFGTITEVQVKTNPDGTCKGVGFVCFATQAEAEKAASEMNAKVLEERALSVRIVERRDGKGEGKGKGKGKNKARETDTGWETKVPGQADPMAGMGYPAGFYEYSMTNPYGYDLGAVYNAMYGSPNMFNGFSMAMSMMPQAEAHKGHGQVDPNAIAALQQAQLFALQSQVAAASKEEAKGKAKGKSKAKGKGKTQEKPTTVVVAEAPPPDKEFVGSLKSLSGKNGYGFIACAEIQEKFHRDVWVDTALLPEGVEVEDRPQLKFNVTLSPKGHPQAKNVRVA
ncbi:unnamed protein product [Durusdinium trenchii]|uniref:RRM domain-containing protein n=1 Tax=Durusdinium trenchii TaxID=1381693 RepID=A0ABP0NNQ0_9DINO